jgi:glyoxalase family protein
MGRVAAGSVHHIAFRAKDDAEQLQWREHLVDLGYNVTPVMDRGSFDDSPRACSIWKT